MVSDSKLFTFEEVSKHNRKDDCWLIISGMVYDVTSFLDDHPGGDDVLLNATAKDATEDFEDVGHSNDAKGMLKKYHVGKVDVSAMPAERKKLAPQPPPPRASADNAQGSGLMVKLFQFLLPLLVLALAFSFKYLKKE